MKSYEYSYRIGKTVPSYDICDGGAYGSHWGITDLYPECEKNLKDLLASDGDFRAEWGSKKELLGATLMRVDGVLLVTVEAWTDDLWESDDLIYDALWDVTHDEKCLTDETIDAIRDYAFELDCDDHASAWWEGQCPDYDTIMEIISGLADAAETTTDTMYQRLVGAVKELNGLGELQFEEDKA